MDRLASLLVLAVAAIHLYILVIEMFLWATPRGQRAFGTTAEFAASTKVLAANQGLYNGFLAAGLVFGLLRGDVATQAFFLACVFVAGLYGAATASKKILLVQSLPATLAAIALALGR